MDEIKILRVEEEILPNEDFSHKSRTLRKYTDEISECDADFFAMVNQVFLDEGQKGEIVDEMAVKTKQMETWNRNLLMEVNERINQIVHRFEEQVDEMKTQEVIYKYKDSIKLGN